MLNDRQKPKKDNDVKDRIDILNDDSVILHEFVEEVEKHEKKHGKKISIGVIND